VSHHALYGVNALALVELAELEAMHRRPFAELTDHERMRRDLLLYGTSFGRRRADGTIEHIPATEMIVSTRTAAGDWDGEPR